MTRQLSSLTAGVKINGLNLQPKPVPSNGLGDPTTWDNYWSVYWGEWDWTWVQIDLDRAVTVGANAVRVQGAPQVTLASIDGMTQLSQATYLNQWTQLADGCTTRGLKLYACLGDSAIGRLGGLSFPDFVTTMVATADMLDDHPAVFALDGYNEYASTYEVADSYITQLRAVTSKPIGLSRIVNGHTNWTDANTTNISRYLTDFCDFHLYYGAKPWELRPLIDEIQKPWMFGEWGMAQNATYPTRLQRLYDMRAIHEIDEVTGMFRWCTSDISYSNNTGNQWGLYSADTGTARAIDLWFLQSARSARLVVP